MNCPAPLAFHPAGNVVFAELAGKNPPFIRQRRYSGRRAEGVRYERKVQKMLLEAFPETYVPSPWLRFRSEDSEKARWCQPDGLIINFETGIINIVEVKYSHTSDAWWQTRKLYAPVLRAIFPAALWCFQFCEIVKWYDPAIAFPEAVELAAEPDKRSDRFKVHIYKP